MIFPYAHKSYGTIIYDPPRGAMRRRKDWWCVINVDKEITRYYRWWLSFDRHIHTQPPAWDAHISIVRGERPRPGYEQFWKKYHGKRVEFFYEHGNIRVDRSQRMDADANKAIGGDYYFIDVTCPVLDEIRQELGLRTGFKFHLTVGRTYEYVSRHELRKLK